MRSRSLVTAALLAMAALTACKREPTFDERYEGAQKAIRDKAGELDKDMVRRAQDARAIAPDPQASQAVAPGKI